MYDYGQYFIIIVYYYRYYAILAILTYKFLKITYAAFGYVALNLNIYQGFPTLVGGRQNDLKCIANAFLFYQSDLDRR